VRDDRDDDWLVDRARSGSVDAFEALARRHRDRVYRTALRLTGNSYDAEDVAQEALVQAWQRLDTFRGDSAFATWLYRIVVTRAYNVRRSTRRMELVDEVPETAAPGADRVVEERQQRHDLAEAIAALPFDRRAPLVLHQFEGLSYDEIAVVLEVSTATVRMRLFRARRELADRMRDWR
jgi:RNA polymerase sigma factor (sigma-70 family)